MPNYRISITSSDQGNRTVAEQTVARAYRDAAVIEGVAELLRQDQFPPEAVQFWVRAMSQASTPAEQADVHDLMMEKFHLQFFCKEADDIAPAPIPQPTAQGTGSTPSPAPTHPFLNGGVTTQPPLSSNLTPRQILRHELKRLNSEITRLEPYYQQLITRRKECRELLSRPPKPKPQRRLQRVEA